MWTFIKPVNLIRYLIVWRVCSSLVILPRPFAKALSSTLGTLIAERLPTSEARAWRRALAAADGSAASPPGMLASGREPGWPIATVLFPYPGKSAYSQGEMIFWELKLLGPSADHGLFLEVILPAMEAAATTTDPRWYQPRSLWGRFNIQAIYAARGPHWEPLAQDGRLNLSCHPTPAQWAEGLDLAEGKASIKRAKGATFASVTMEGQVATPSASAPAISANDAPAGTSEFASPRPSPPTERSDNSAEKSPLRQLIWIMPFDLNVAPAATGRPSSGTTANGSMQADIPSIRQIIAALMARMTLFLPDKYHGVEQAWALLSEAERDALEGDIERVRLGPSRRQVLKPAPKEWPRCRIGAQVFEALPWTLLPYLELASILHIGRLTHFGCGTFMLR